MNMGGVATRTQQNSIIIYVRDQSLRKRRMISLLRKLRMFLKKTFTKYLTPRKDATWTSESWTRTSM